MPVAAIKSDREIQQDVLKELRSDSRVDETEIGVEVDAAVVTLTGTVGCRAKKLAAREAAHRVLGVLDVADDVRVKLPGSQLSDTEIAQAVRFALEWDTLVPDRDIRSTVSDALVTLEGEVRTLRQKQDAGRVVRALSSVKGVNNWLTVAPTQANPGELRKSIEQALERRSEGQAEKIRVKVEDGTVILEGRVRTWPQKKAVLGAVSHAPGVRRLTDHLFVSPWD
jgi:osmotically-inducible protein OsmY